MPKLRLIKNAKPDDPAIAELRRRLDEFYSTTQTYTAFSESHDSDNSQKPFHDLMLPLLKEMRRPGKKLQILELGAGRPSFPGHLGELRSEVEYHVQDVTPANREYLDRVADRVFICDSSQIEGRYDMVFSTFVLEHVSSPETFLTEVNRLLNPGGLHIVFSPRYDMPGYICPSLRHLGRTRRGLVSLRLLLSRAMARIDRKPRFWINLDPAMFHVPWFRDADAVHLVGRVDVEKWHEAHGFKVTRLFPEYSGFRDMILKRGLILSLACRKISGR